MEKGIQNLCLFNQQVSMRANYLIDNELERLSRD
jgi:hypothetical protein